MQKKGFAISLISLFLLSSIHSNAYAGFYGSEPDYGDDVDYIDEPRGIDPYPYYIPDDSSDSSYDYRPGEASYRIDRYNDRGGYYRGYGSRSYPHENQEEYSSSQSNRLPSHISPPGEKVIIVNPQVHAFGAYTADGTLVREGMASSGSNWCKDLHRPCHTKSGSFRIASLGSSHCVSSMFPLGKGGAPMPYCMYFNRNQALHGSYEVADGNISHGCVRLHVPDAEWLRFNFARVGTKVIVKHY